MNEQKPYTKCKVLAGKDEVPTGSFVLIPSNVGVASDYGLVVGLVDVLAVLES